MVCVNQRVNQMNATIEVICYKWKKVKNDEHPLMLRVTIRNFFFLILLSCYPIHLSSSKDSIQDT